VHGAPQNEQVAAPGVVSSSIGIRLECAAENPDKRKRRDLLLHPHFHGRLVKTRSARCGKVCVEIIVRVELVAVRISIRLYKRRRPGPRPSACLTRITFGDLLQLRGK